ncbi:MAG: type III pantothenate kinase, partial [Bdellovibrionales bacterium]
MLLTIDAGNTNTVFALCDGETIKHVWRCETNARRTGDEYASWLHQVFQIEGYKFEQISNVVISSVVPDANFNFQKLSKKYFGSEGKLVNVEWV